jgi:hypothetical protein
MARKPKQKPTGTKPSPAIEHLARLAIDLRGLVEREKKLRALGRTFPPTISQPVAEFVLAALEKFEADPGKGLDRAFGLIRPGRPLSGAEDENYPLAKWIFRLRVAGKSWTKMARWCDRDVREIQRMHNRYERHIRDEWLARSAINSAD